MKNIKHILFVCTGNSCRSIMAEAYLKKRSGEEGLSLEIKSAGTLGTDGLTPTKETIQVISEEGINPDEFESKALTNEFIEWADIILVMEPAHKVKLLDMAPGTKDKVKYLGEYNKDKGEVAIADPIGQPLEYYRKCFNAIKQPIERLIKWLKE